MNRIKVPEALRAQRGSALVLAIVMVACLATLSVAMMTVAMGGNSVANNSTSRQQALYMAQSGVAMALDQLNSGQGSGSIGNYTSTAYFKHWGPDNQQSYVVTFADLGGGYFKVRSYGSLEEAVNGTTEVAGGGKVNDTLITTDSTGTYMTNTSGRMIEAIVGFDTSSGGFTAGAFGVDSVTLHNFNTSSGGGQMTTSSYSSVAGSSVLATMGNVGSNGPITLTDSNGSGIKVNGSVTPGVGKSVTKNGAVTVTGSTAARTTPVVINIPTYSPPSGLTATTPGATITGSSGAAAPTNIRFATWPITQATTVTGNVALYVDGAITQTKGKKLSLAAGAVLQIYHGSGNITLYTDDTSMSTPGAPNNFNIDSSSTGTITIAADNNFNAVIFAPAAAINLVGVVGGNNGLNFSGALLGKTLDIEVNVTYRVDLAAKSPGMRTRYVLKSWREVAPRF